MNERHMKIMVPYQEPTTDTCPDCSDIPCDCGLPAGYKSDIRFAANFAPHIKVIEASKVAEIIEQRDDLLRYNEAFRQEALICADCDAISKKDYDQAIEQLTASREEIERLQCAGIHSCHDNCERPNCVLRREIKALTEQRDELHELHNKNATRSKELLELCGTLREQRDRLAEALKQMWPFIEEDDYPACNTPSFNFAIKKYKEALAAVKGLADES